MLVLCLSSCGKKEKVISRGDMAKIYAEMFVADQRLGKTSLTKRMADTSFVYEPIFKKYGYTAQDYNASVDYYINDATRYARILRQSSVILEKEVRALKREKELQEMTDVARNIDRYRPDTLYFMTGVDNPRRFRVDSLVFYVDSTGGRPMFDVRDWADTAYYGPGVVIRDDLPDCDEGQGLSEDDGEELSGGEKSGAKRDVDVVRKEPKVVKTPTNKVVKDSTKMGNAGTRPKRSFRDIRESE